MNQSIYLSIYIDEIQQLEQFPKSDILQVALEAETDQMKYNEFTKAALLLSELM
jgi:hypothetical protein